MQPSGQQVLQGQHLPQQQVTHSCLLTTGWADALGSQAPDVNLMLQFYRERKASLVSPPTSDCQQHLPPVLTTHTNNVQEARVNSE